MDASIKALHKNFMEWAAGPVGSITLHIVGIVLLFLFASLITPKEPDPEIEVTMIEVDEQKLDELLEEKPPEELPDLVETITPPDVNMEMTPPEVEEFTAAPLQESVDLNIASDAISPIVMKGLAPGQMANRSGLSNTRIVITR